jgi:MYXO-CTERM domain-containing protein
MIRVIALALVALSSTTAFAQTLGRRPYVQRVSPTSAVIVWTTTTATTGRVRYGTDVANLSQTVDDGMLTQHEVVLSGLSPSTRYYYSVGTTAGAALAGGDSDHYFVTAPVAGTRGKFRAWVVGDSGTGGARQADVRDAMLRFAGLVRPNLYLHLGDMAYDAGTTAEFTTNFFNVYATILRNTPVWPAIGNHEGTNSDSATETGPYYTAYVVPRAAEAGGLPSGTEAYYSFDYANVHFIVLDSHETSRAPNGAMLTWMRNDLAATDQEWVIAYWHHPPYTKGSHDSDTESQLVEMRENALPILEAGGVDLVLAGHSHIYERSFLLDGAYDTPTVATGHIKDSGDGRVLGNGPYRKQVGQVAHDGAVYVVAGHGGTGVSGAGNHPVMYMSELQNGSCILDIQENRLSLVNIRYDGAITDRFSMVKGPGLVLGAPDGGEALAGGMTATIRWATVGTVPTVKLELSFDGGASWAVIAPSVPNSGSYDWTVPPIDTTRALVRVSSTSDPSLRDESNGEFTIRTAVLSKVIPFGSVWKYHDRGADLGAAWLANGYDDSVWASGPAQLGVGEGDEATTVAGGRPTYYFRRRLMLDGPVVAANLKVLHDDGVAVWVNGIPVFSKYMANGTGYAAFASATSADNEVSTAMVPLAPSPFVTGENVIAVMVKQVSATSSDVSFDLELELAVGNPLPDLGAPDDLAAPVPDDGDGGASMGGGGGGGGGCGCRVGGGAPASNAPLPIAVVLALGFIYRLSRRRWSAAARHRATEARRPCTALARGVARSVARIS